MTAFDFQDDAMKKVIMIYDLYMVTTNQSQQFNYFRSL